MINSCYLGDVRDGLRAMASAGVRARTCVTSPPYWGLRDYGVAGQLGLEPTIDEYVANMVDVFRLVREVLTDDGTLWLNLGDSYNADRNGGHPGGAAALNEGRDLDKIYQGRSGVNAPGLKPKDLCGIPWRVALALQADGWWLRQDIIWHKPNPMPESVTDRCTKAHEYVFLLSKRERYYFNAQAIREPIAEDTLARYDRGRSDNHKWADGGPGDQTIARSFDHMRKPVAGWANDGGSHSAIDHAQARAGRDGKMLKKSGNKERKTPADRGAPEGGGNQAGSVPWEGDSRNKRSVWTIPTEPFPEAHFATFPTALVEPCVLAGSAIGDVVLDPFMGSGTVAQVAQALGRSWVGCELNPEYHAMIARRTRARGLALA